MSYNSEVINVKIQITRKMIEKLEVYQSNHDDDDSWEYNKSNTLLKEQREILDGYKDKYPEEFI